MSLFSEREVKGTAAFVLLSGLLILVLRWSSHAPRPTLPKPLSRSWRAVIRATTLPRSTPIRPITRPCVRWA